MTSDGIIAQCPINMGFITLADIFGHCDAFRHSILFSCKSSHNYEGKSHFTSCKDNSDVDVNNIYKPETGDCGNSYMT